MYSATAPVHNPAPSVLILEPDDFPCDQYQIETIVDMAETYDAYRLDGKVKIFYVTFESWCPATDRLEKPRWYTADQLREELRQRSANAELEDALLCEQC